MTHWAAAQIAVLVRVFEPLLRGLSPSTLTVNYNEMADRFDDVIDEVHIEKRSCREASLDVCGRSTTLSSPSAILLWLN